MAQPTHLELKTDFELAAALMPLLAELENRMVAQDHAGQAARVVQLRTYLMCDFGREKTLKAPDKKTRPMFDDQVAGEAANTAGGLKQ
jgi:hypothetical protein